MINGPEYFRETILETCHPELLATYKHSQRAIQKAIRAVIEPSPYGESDPTSGLGLALMRLQELPHSIQDMLDPDDQITKAAMLIGAVSLRAWIYKSDTTDWENRSFESIWEHTKLQRLAATCDEVIGQVLPENQGQFVNINLDQMKAEHNRKIKVKTREHIVLTGLNAAGKTSIIKKYMGYLEVCNIHASVVKMPRPDGPFAKLILAALQGDLKVKKEALMLAFLADAFDYEPEPDTLMIFDRHPKIDTFGFGIPETARLTLASHEIIPDIYQTFIIDQHPMSCALKVSERAVAPRIFEDDVEKMTEQLLRFARLTVLPGIHWINNDIPADDSSPNSVLDTAYERFVGAVHHSGVLQRRLLNEGIFHSYTEASRFLYLKHLDYSK